MKSKAFLSILAGVTSLYIHAAGQSLQSLESFPLLFDFGSEASPVADAAIRVTAASRFSRDARFGFLREAGESFDRDRPLPSLKHSGNPMRPDLLYQSHVTNLLQDGVSSERDLRFRVLLPNGRYRVQVWVGDLHHARESIAVEAQGEAVRRGMSVKHIIGRSRPESTGFYRWVRFDADVMDGTLDLRLYADEERFQEEQAEYEAHFGQGERVDTYLGGTWDPAKPLKFDPTGPSSQNSILALRIAPVRDSVLSWNEGRLVGIQTLDGALATFVDDLNAGRWSDAESYLRAATHSLVHRVQGSLALLGHPSFEGSDEDRLVPFVDALIEGIGETRDVRLLEARESWSVFRRARQRFHERGFGEEGHFQENRKVVSMMRLIEDHELLYPKSLIYQGRAWQMLDPHRWVYASGEGRAVWQTLRQRFPQNRYVRFYLEDVWERDGIWAYGDHLPKEANAPDWAIAQREAWGLLLEMCEWWAAHKQQADGGIGGGWGDDVELVALFGIMSFISDGASPPSLNLARRLVNGLWKYGGMDVGAGFYRGVLDAEHSAEWTGDTLPFMLTVDWGNPIWVERAMQSAYLMRHLWMDYNDRGFLQFRSNFLGAIAVGPSSTANDSYINYRAALPALATYRYNRHPAIERLFVEWADAWLDASMRADRDKPKGVFPAEVGFPKAKLGGVDSPNWYTAAHPPGTVNYDWERGNYYGYLVDLMLFAHEVTGDKKYLKPFVLQKSLVDAYRSDPVAEPSPGTAAWVGRTLDDKRRRGALNFDELWQRVEQRLTGYRRGDPPVLNQPKDVFAKMDHVRREMKRRWPVLTTETSATDRVGFRGIPDPFYVMTGTRDMKPSVTYSGLGREFAAFVRREDSSLLEVVMYPFGEPGPNTALVPWKLDVGGEYQVRVFEFDELGKVGALLSEKRMTLHQLGQRVPIPLEAGRTSLVSFRQVGQANAALPLRADLAVIADELLYSAWTRDLQVTLHNVGSRAAQRIKVVFAEHDPVSQQETEVGVVVVPSLEWPMGLRPQRLTVGVPYLPNKPKVTLSVRVDPENEIPELCESNNQASRSFHFDLETIRGPRNRVGEIGGDVSGEIRKGLQ